MIKYLGDFGNILRSILVIMIQILVIVIPNNSRKSLDDF